MSSNNKDIEAYLRTLRKEGFTMKLARGSGHWHIFTPEGERIATCPESTGDRRAWRNTRRDIEARLGRSSRGKVAAPPPSTGSDPEVLELYRKQVRAAIDEGRDLDAVFLDWKNSGEPVKEADLIAILIEEEQR